MNFPVSGYSKTRRSNSNYTAQQLGLPQTVDALPRSYHCASSHYHHQLFQKQHTNQSQQVGHSRWRLCHCFGLEAQHTSMKDHWHSHSERCSTVQGPSHSDVVLCCSDFQGPNHSDAERVVELAAFCAAADSPARLALR